MSKYIKVDALNIDKEHICCALSSNDAHVKKEWMKQQFEYGYTFIKLNERGKVFIDYVVSEHAFSPIQASNMMFIYCLWVSGKYAKQGHGGELLNKAEQDAKERGKEGMVIISSRKKKPFLSDYEYLVKKGYEVADEGYGDYVLLCKPFHKKVVMPSFIDKVRNRATNEKQLVLYYTDQCVFSQKYAKDVYQKAKEKGWLMKLVKLNDRQDVCDKGVISPAYSLFYNGEFITNEIMSVAKFEKVISKLYVQ